MQQVNPTLARTRAHQVHNGNIKCGERKPAATETETHSLNLAIVALRNAKEATNETHFLNQLREAYNLCRNTYRSRVL